MANFIAIEWDGNEARVALARRKGREVIIDDAFSIPLEPRDPGQTFAAPNVGARVAAELAARKVGRVETLVAVGRKDIELRTLTIPPTPPEELPDVVRFQAVRQFSALGDDWPLDFLPLGDGDEAGTNVLAATLSPEHIKQIRATCEVGGLTPRRLVLRPMAAASLLTRQLPDAAGRCRLMIDMLSDEADLTVLMGERVVFLRTAKLPSHGEEAQSTVLLGEIRRTIIAAQNQLGGQRVDYIVVCGNPGDHSILVERLGRELSLPVECFDPFAALPLADDLRHRLPDHHGRFAPLLGMLVDECANTPHAIDFLNPRKRPPKKNNRNTYALYGLAATLLIAAIGGYFYWSYSSLTGEIRTVRNEINALKPSTEVVTKVQDVDRFAYGDINWLNEMHRLADAKHFLTGDDAKITQFSAVVREAKREGETSGGVMTIDGVMRESAQIRELEEALAYDDPKGKDEHTAESRASIRQSKDPKYPWNFGHKINITHPDFDAAKLRTAPRGAGARRGGAAATAPKTGNK